MALAVLERTIKNELRNLSMDEKHKVLFFAQALVNARPRGTSGKTLLQFGGSISQKDCSAIKTAIEDGCERVNANEW
jgi:hypothetical protein